MGSLYSSMTTTATTTANNRDDDDNDEGDHDIDNNNVEVLITNNIDRNATNEERDRQLHVKALEHALIGKSKKERSIEARYKEWRSRIEAKIMKCSRSNFVKLSPEEAKERRRMSLTTPGKWDIYGGRMSIIASYATRHYFSLLNNSCILWWNESCRGRTLIVDKLYDDITTIHQYRFLTANHTVMDHRQAKAKMVRIESTV